MRAMLARKPAKLVAVALANRTARVVWAVIGAETASEPKRSSGKRPEPTARSARLRG